MYPLELDAAYPRNHWYVAGHGFEFGREVVAKTILDDPLIFYRTEAGEPVALWGRCMHRHMPMEMGTREGDAVVCAYHGYRYEADGHCSRIPTGGIIPKSARLKRYPVIEHGPLVWIWMGDEARADPILLPKPTEMGFGADAASWRFDASKTFALQARPTLLIDNLFDLSHISFIHAKSLTLPANEIVIEPRSEMIGDHLRVTRAAAGPNETNSFWKFVFPTIERPVYRELITEFHNPGLINAAQWLFEIAPDGGKGEPIGFVNFIHIVTPETAHSTHYIGLISRDFRQDDEEFSKGLVDVQDEVRQEDVIALGAIERNLDRHASSRREISTRADEGAIKIRRKLRELIEAERQSVAVAAQ